MSMYDHRGFQNAQTYAWGRQDAGDDEHDTERSAQFAQAYAERCIAFDAERVSGYPNLRAAYEEWRATGVISAGFHATVKRRLPSLSPDKLTEVSAALWLAANLGYRPIPFLELDAESQDHWRDLSMSVLRQYAEEIGAEFAPPTEEGS